MAFEIECGSCSGRFEVEEGSTIVICPHCNMTLQLPGAPQPEEATANETSVETPADGPISGFPVGAEAVSEEELPNINTGEDAPLPNIHTGEETQLPNINTAEQTQLPNINTGEETPLPNVETGEETPAAIINTGEDSGLPFINTGESQQPATSDSAVTVVETPPVTVPAPQATADSSAETTADSRIFPGFAPQAAEPDAGDGNFAAAIAGFAEPEAETVAFTPAGDERPAATASPSQPLLPDSTEVAPAAAPAAAEKAAPAKQHKGPSQLAYLIMAGYASAITLLFAYFWYTRGRIHPLESLPDVARPKVGSVLVPEDAPMPRGHTLKIGDTQQFGNLKVTVMKVTRGPMKLKPMWGGGSFATQDVLRLWLRIENVSDDQHIMPFGRKLMLLRGTPQGREEQTANIFVCRASQKKRGGHLVLMHLLDDEWEVEGQHIDRELSPGEEYTTFLSTRELDPDELSKGDLVWRVHIRKGYNPESKRGVTTVFEVTFNANEIQKESNAG